MKKALMVMLACLLGAFGAIQLDRLWASRTSSTPVLGRTGFSGVVQAQNEPRGAGAPDFRDAAKRILPAVVSIDVVTEWFGRQIPGGSGSGVVISNEGHIVTNSHVIEDGQVEGNITVHLSDGRSFAAKLLGNDPLSDLAVLKIEANNLTPAEIGSSRSLEVGEWVLAVGNPFRQENTVSAGIIGNIGRDIQLTRSAWLIDAIQTDASINPGNSGGALTNAAGQLVGINTAILSPRSGSSVGIGFAIPIDRAKPVIEDLIKLGRARYGFTGIEVAGQRGLLQIPGARKQYQIETGVEPPESGVLVIRVEPGSPAAKAGIKELDVIQRVENQEIRERDDFISATYGRRPGERIQVSFWSRGETKVQLLSLEELTNR